MQIAHHEQLIEKIENLKQEAVALRKGIRAVFEKQRFADSVRSLFHQCKRLTGATAGFVALLTEEGEAQDMVLQDSGDSPGPNHLFNLPIQGLGLKAFREAEVVYENRFRTGQWAEYLPQGVAGPDNILFSPLTIENRGTGLLCLANKPGGFTPEDAELAVAFSDLAAMALTNARYEEQRIKFEQSLLGSQTELSAIYENAPVIMILVDSERRVRKANHQALNFAGRTSQEMIGLRGGEALGCLFALKNGEACGDAPECGDCVVRQTISDSLETGKSHSQVEASLPFIVNDQEMDHAFLLSTTPLQIQGEQMVLASIMDITQHKQAQAALCKSEERLVQAQKMEAIGTLAGGIAHDFNNILFPLLGFAEMLKEDLAQQSPLQDHVDEILHAALRSRELVQQILAFSHKTEPRARMVSIQTIVKEAIKLIRAAIPATIKVQQSISPDCAPVNADPTQLHQIIMNLATNAYHAMEEKGGLLEISLDEVHVKATGQDQSQVKPGRYARLCIGDTGVGISPEVLEKVFDPYFSTKDEGKGTGLGLSVVHGIVRSHQGMIKIESTPGQGTTCTVFLPVVESGTVYELDDEIADYPHGTERVMIVDDETAIIRMLVGMLNRLGYQVTPYTVSTEALKGFESAPDDVDLVITDMTMPDMTGIKLARKIKQLRPDTPVIICTGYSERLDPAGAKALGMEGYLMKPVTIQEMAETVRKVLDRRGK